jgi:hypothetical protein
MIVLFFKASDDARDEDDANALPEKMRLILLTHIKESETPEEKDRAERQLAEFDGDAT